jgi:hypothetical protein
MPDLHTPFGALTLIQLFISAFFAICFLQSGIDKVLDRRGNLEFLTGHLSSSPLAGTVPVLFFILTVLELAAGALSAIGCLLVLVRHTTAVAFYGTLLSALALLALFFGQRLAKDYPGAAVLVPYFLLALAGIYFLA